jgi:hypothetical protein
MPSRVRQPGGYACFQTVPEIFSISAVVEIAGVRWR